MRPEFFQYNSNIFLVWKSNVVWKRDGEACMYSDERKMAEQFKEEWNDSNASILINKVMVMYKQHSPLLHALSNKMLRTAVSKNVKKEIYQDQRIWILAGHTHKSWGHQPVLS